MADEPKALHMVHARIDVVRLFQLAKRRHLPARQADNGYLVHCLLGELFGDRAPAPFALRGQAGRHLDLLAYASHPKEALHDHARAFADPSVYDACDWRSFTDKPMPDRWRPGHRLGFEVRLCPVVRMASAGAKHRKGAEVDAFLARCWQVGPQEGVERSEVYGQWLTDQLERRGGARILDVRLHHFRRVRLVRRKGAADGREAALCERPDATLRGELEITQPDAFTQLLASGVGRHRAFGFGMLLLRPPRPC